MDFLIIEGSEKNVMGSYLCKLIYKEEVNMDILKYPRTRHIEGSNLQIGDEDIENIRFNSIKENYLVVEEKIDGANCGVSFDNDGKLLLQSRGHYLNGGYREKQFNLFKLWANTFYAELYNLLGNRYIMYGEWMFAKHTVFYDALPHYFFEFDIYDRKKKIFLSTPNRRRLLKNFPFIQSVRVLYEGYIDRYDDLINMVGKSLFKTKMWEKSLYNQCIDEKIDFSIVKKQTDLSENMEGLYIKAESADEVTMRFKYVRHSFLSSILDSETHWMDRPILPNKLMDGVDLFSFGGGLDE